MSEPGDAPTMRDQILAVLARELTATRIVRTGGHTAAGLAHRFDGTDIDGEGLTEYEAVPDENTAVLLIHGSGSGDTGMTKAVTLGHLADSLVDAVNNGAEPGRPFPFGFTVPAAKGNP